MLGSLHAMDVRHAREAQVTRHKVKLSNRLSFQRGGWIKASDALEKKKVKVGW